MMKTLQQDATWALSQKIHCGPDAGHLTRGRQASAALFVLLAIGSLPAMAEDAASPPPNRLTLSDTQPLAEQVTPAVVAQIVQGAAPGRATVQVSGKHFPADGHFPQSGFTGATFQVQANGQDAQDNGKYQWHSSQPWAGVDSAGTVTFKTMPTPEARTVTVTATPTAGGEALSTTFSVSHWFINAKAEKMTWSAAETWCQSQGEGFALPDAVLMTTSDGRAPAQRAANGALWNAWGPMALYRNGWQLGNYWAAREQKGKREMVGLVNGTFHWVPESSQYLVSCVRGLQ